MHSFQSSAPPRRAAGFTLVEIMVVVVIIGLLAVLALPAFSKSRQSSQNNRFISDLRVFAQAFENYSLMNGAWPPNAGSGTVPAGMAGDIRHANWTVPNSVGGLWNWDFNNSGVVAAIATTNVTASDLQMQMIDKRIDDGDLTTGLFRKVGTRFIYIMEE
jgi:type IV pilus assembly protein PilA